MKLCRQCGIEKDDAKFARATWYTKSGEKRTGLASECKSCFRVRNADYYGKHKDRLSQRKKVTNAAWYRKNREKVKRRVLEYNRSINYRYSHKRRVKVGKQTPPWADKDAIKFFYECRPEGCHVDHIIPLQGKVVCGLHVADNLQWMPAKRNQQKGNKLEGF